MVISGCVLQLSSIGPQNAYINDASNTLFKTAVRKYSNFAAGQVLVSPSGGGNSGYFGSEITYKLPRAGDLIHKVYFTFIGTALDAIATNLVPVPPKPTWVDDLGHSVVEYCQIDIGSTRFDRIQGEQLHIIAEQEESEGKDSRVIVGDNGLGGVDQLLAYASINKRYFVPLPFWFHNFLEQVCPIIALMFHDIDIKIKLRNRQDVISLGKNASTDVYTPVGASLSQAVPPTHPEYVVGPSNAFNRNYEAAVNVRNPADITGGLMLNPQLLVTYIYLDQLERKLFAGSAHEYVITQHQFLGPQSFNEGTSQVSFLQNFSHPVKEFSMVVRRNQTIATDYAKNWVDFTGQPYYSEFYPGSNNQVNGTIISTAAAPQQAATVDWATRGDPITYWNISLNNHARLVEQTDFGTDYYRYVVPLECHSRVSTKPIYNFSFAWRPENQFSTGTLNCSRIDNIEFSLRFPQYTVAGTVLIFAKSFNAIKIASGLAGQRFSS
jgi:hypothetical protein